MGKKPLYRKVNTKARGVNHNFGGDFKNHRLSKNYDVIGMTKSVERGLDYTPLFKFLLSNVGKNWASVHSEAVSRLDKEEPIYWLVAKTKELGADVVRVGESSYFSGLYIDQENILRIVAPAVGYETLEPSCKCCTHTLNGMVFVKKYSESKN